MGDGVAVEGGSHLVESFIFRHNAAWAAHSCFGIGLCVSGTLEAVVSDNHF